MSEALVIRLLKEDGPGERGTGYAEWAVVDATGACVLAPASGRLADAAPLGAGRRTIVLVPAVRVLRTRVDVPVRGATRIVQALPFALEDLLAEDVDELHFAAGPRDADGRVAVAVVRRQWMADWLTELADAGIQPQALHAESDAVLDIAGTSTLILERDQALLRDPGFDPAVAGLDALDGLLELWLAQPRATAADGSTAPRHLQVYDATVDGVPNTVWEALQDRVDSLEVRRLPDGALLRLAATIATTPGVNLLQGEYARRTGVGSYWPRWRLAAALVATLAAAILATTGVDAWRLKRESAALEAEIRQAASFTFPGVDPSRGLRDLVDARLRGTDSAKAGGANRQFLETLRTVALAVAKTGNASIEAVNYRTGVLELQVRAPSAEALDSIRRSVVEAGKLKAEIQSSNAAGEEIQGRIRISGAGA